MPEEPSVFLVDEDGAVRDALAMSLRAAGHTVAAFGSGRQFLDAYRRDDPGCLVADMDLPDLGAVELLRTLAASQAALPAIITSRRLKRVPPRAGSHPGGSCSLISRLASMSCCGSSGSLWPAPPAANQGHERRIRAIA